MKEVLVLAPKNKSWVFNEATNKWEEVLLKNVNVKPIDPIIEIDENQELLNSLRSNMQQAKNEVALAIIELKQKREVFDNACYLGADLTQYSVPEKEKIQKIIEQLNEKISEYDIKKQEYELVKLEYISLSSEINAGSI